MGGADDIADKILDYLRDGLLAGIPALDIDRTSPLISGGILDSVATLEVVTFLEDAFGVTIEAHEADVDYMDSVDKMVELVREKQKK